MRVKFISLVFFLCLGGWVVQSQLDVKDLLLPYHQKLTQMVSSNPSMNAISISAHAKSLGGVLTSPSRNHMVTNGDFMVSGSIKRYQLLKSRYVWVFVEFLGKKDGFFPKSYSYYISIEEGKFSEKVHLSCGKGMYRISLRISSQEDKEAFYAFSDFEIENKSKTIKKDVLYSMAAKKIGLNLQSPRLGYMEASNHVYVKGTLKKRVKEKRLLIQVKKGKEIWQKTINSLGLEFDEDIPLLFGLGVHQVQVMLPDNESKGYYAEGATFYVHNDSTETLKPIQFSKIYRERGIHLVSPVAGGENYGLKYRLAGYIDPKARYAKQTDHVVVRITKNQDQATYFIPVKQFKFDDTIWLRFGSGRYTVELLVSEITKKQQDFFRFFTVTRVDVDAKGLKDVRDLIPSRGVNSKDPRIIQLSQQLTKGKKTEREKAKAIYRFVSQYMNYDVKKLNGNGFSWKDDSLKALRTKQGVCQDYVFLTLSLLRAAQIPSRFIEGRTHSQPHAWVEAWVNKKWVPMDPTWGSGYLMNGKFIKKFDTTYFDPSPSTFTKTHQRIGIIY